MSSLFMTKNLAAEKLGSSVAVGGTEYITKAECLEMGADPELLAGYQDHHYLIDEHVQPGKQTWAFRVCMGEEGSPMNLGPAFGGEVMFYYV